MSCWLSRKTIETKLTIRHLHNGNTIFYDLSSTYIEGDYCSLGCLGCSYDKKRDKPLKIYISTMIT